MFCPEISNVHRSSWCAIIYIYIYIVDVFLITKFCPEISNVHRSSWCAIICFNKSAAGAGRWRSHDKRPTDYLQQDLADRGVAHAVVPISHHHPPQDRQPTAMPELSYHQPHQPPEQSYADDLAEPIQAASGNDHR